MFKSLHVILPVVMLLLCLSGHGQPMLEVQRFEYIWQKDFAAMSEFTAPRVIIPSDGTAKLQMKNSFAKVLQNRWNIILPEFSFTVKPLSVLANTPKFKTSVKNAVEGKWYLFLQVYDKGNFNGYRANEDSLSTTLELKCRLVSGPADSVVFEKDLTVDIYREAAPPGQVLLNRLAAHPAFFSAAFDSIATWLFQPGALGKQFLNLKPACVFEETAIKTQPLSSLLFVSDRERLHQLRSPEFSLNRLEPITKKVDIKRNVGGNTAAGALTLFTGIKTNKNRSFEYQADYSFKEGDSTYHCLIEYVEHETAEQERNRGNDNGTEYSTVKSTYYRLLERYIDTAFVNLVTMGEDTLANFTIKYESNTPRTYDRIWDGSDSTTIISLPPEWNNKKADANLVISGNMKGNPFLMKTAKETLQKEFFINGQLAAVMQGNNEPSRAFLYQPLSTLQLKLFTILSSLPYAYFNESHVD